MDYYKIGQRIRKYRKSHSMSQEQLAEIIGISVTHMSHIETGNTKLSLPVFISIAKALDIQTDDLLSDTVGGRKIAIAEIEDILASSSTQQIRIITDVVKAVKTSLDSNDK